MRADAEGSPETETAVAGGKGERREALCGPWRSKRRNLVWVVSRDTRWGVVGGFDLSFVSSFGFHISHKCFEARAESMREGNGLLCKRYIPRWDGGQRSVRVLIFSWIFSGLLFSWFEYTRRSAASSWWVGG